ncbi:MAG: DUF4139 domain-containing protein [Bacteroidota bacterium]|nr:DUF4139 domain-containing protein [Bacteroidota bacterium]MDP4232000.1 DUF4139 domain-containing protein [Bacteroidota bacterium]MDP4241293.1 DUF4139 domain-containing protein [Bacteroidota bacterium]MDP4286685.1 DUF4139 domain-containing protein [Bacteroidota bacterium]
MKHLIWVFLSSFLATSSFAQQVDNRQSVALTVYNNDLGVVRDVRRFDLKQGTGEVRMTDVPSRIDPTTVKITDLAHPKDVDAIEQNYEYDLISQDKLLEKYIDKTITLTSTAGKRLTGTLLAVETGKLMIMTDSGIISLSGLTGYTLNMPQLGGLYTKPSLVWQMHAARTMTGEPLEVMYQTGGISWHAEYIAALADDDRSVDLTGWVSIDNKSGMSYPDAKLKLVAGAINRVQPPPISFHGSRGTANAITMNDVQFQEHGMFEYHVYDLGRQTTIGNNEVKQISLLSADKVAVEKQYTYEGGKSVAVTIALQNSEANHLGMPIPMGTVRVMKRDKDGSLEFVGEDHIEHTPRDEKITLHVGNAFDLTGERTVTNQQSLGPNANEETVEITLKNHKDEPVTIDAIENLGTNWEIAQSSMSYEKRDAYHIVFHVPVNSHGEEKITYTVRHRW